MKIKLLVPIVLGTLVLSSCGKTADKTNEPYSSETLVIARSENDDSHTDYVIKNLKSENKYNIEEKRYSTSDLLTMALLGGEQIDVIFADKDINVSSFAAKGVLTDLTQYINEDDYVKSVLDSLKQNGKLYEMPYDFDVESAAVKKKLWNDDTDTSFEHILEKSNALGCKYPFDYTVDSYGFTAFIMSKFVDFENKICTFDSDEFKELIEFMKTYNKSVANLTDEQLYDAFKNDEMLMIATGFSSFGQLDYLEYDARDEIEFVGFPSDEENFHIAVLRSAYSVVDGSEHKEEAIDFVKKCISFDSYVTELSDGSKTVLNTCSLPINSEALDYFYDLNFKLEFYDIPDDARKDNADELMHQINTVSYASRMSDTPIQQIIQDELSAYFSGNTDSQSVVKNIQNRCMLFFDEQYN